MIFTGVNDISHKEPSSIPYGRMCLPGSIVVFNYCDEDETMDDAQFSWDKSTAENFPHSKGAVLVNLADAAEAAGYGLRFAEAPKSKVYPHSYFLSFKFLMKISGTPGHGKQIKRIVNDLRETLSNSSTIVRRDGLYVFRAFSSKRHTVSSTVSTGDADDIWRFRDYLRAAGPGIPQRGHRAQRIDIDDAIRYRIDNLPANEVVNVVAEAPAQGDLNGPIRVRYLNQDWAQGDIVINFVNNQVAP